MTSISLLDAARDPQLLGATVHLWPRQVDLLDSLDGPEAMHVWAIGRQASKSTLGAMAATHNATLRPDLDAVLPRGRTRYVLAAAPSEDQAREFIALCAALIDASPLLRERATVKADRIDFALPRSAGSRTWTARTAIRAMAANSRTVRGMSASLLVLDEFAHFTDTAGPASDARMLTALSPSLRAFGALGRTLVISTPFGETGKFYELFRDAQAGVLPSARAVQAPVWDVVVPGLDQAWLDARRSELGEDSFRQEYGAEFVAGGGQFFDLRAVDFADGPVAPEDGSRWVAAFDPGFHADLFGVAVVGVSKHEPGLLVAGRLEGLRPPPAAKSLEARRSREDATLAAAWKVIEPYAPCRVVSDQHQADAIRSYFGRKGCGVTIRNLTGPLQTAAFVSTRTRLTDGSLRLWRYPQLVEDLRRVRAGSTEKIELPRFGGSHCDVASALALAVYELRTVRRDGAAGTLVRVGHAPAPRGERGAEQVGQSFRSEFDQRKGRWRGGVERDV